MSKRLCLIPAFASAIFGGFKIGVVGQNRDLTYQYDYLGAGGTLQQIAAGTHPFAETLRNAERPMLILGLAHSRGPMVRQSWRGT